MDALSDPQLHSTQTLVATTISNLRVVSAGLVNLKALTNIMQRARIIGNVLEVLENVTPIFLVEL